MVAATGRPRSYPLLLFCKIRNSAEQEGAICMLSCIYARESDSCMRLEITESERKLLLELLEGEQKQFIQELDHTDRRDYKTLLRGRLDVLEGLVAKVQNQGIA
jgi:hypothetical protein